MSTAAVVLAWLALSLAVGLVVYAAFIAKRAPKHVAPLQHLPRPEPIARVEQGTVNVVRPARGVEGLEIQYERSGIVRSVRVGAMNCEHKELLLTMDGTRWKTLTNAGKQEVLAAARSTWAAKMCPSGPDIAYVVIETEKGEIVGRADPRSVTIA